MKLIEQVTSSFLEEAHERLAELEATLLDLEAEPTNAELVAKAFRAMHTIKGSGAMFGFEAVASFTHELETVFDEVRNGRLAVTQTLIGLALECRDLIRRLLAGDDEGTAADRTRLAQALRAFQPVAGKPAPAPVKKDEIIGNRPPPEKTYRVFFRPNPELFRNGSNPMGLLNELAEFGPCRTIACTRSVPGLTEIDPESCYVAWDIIITTRKSVDDLRGVFVFVEELCTLRIDLVDDGESREGDDNYKKLGEILVERGDLTTEQLKACLSEQKRVGELLVAKGAVAPETVEAAAQEQKAVREARAKREAQGHGDNATSIRVAADKLDYLVDLVGELVIAQARLGQLAGNREDGELLNVAETMDHLAAELRDSTLSIRMVPIGTTFGRFKRLVRDLSTELGKEIDLQTEGAETELDKTVIERLGDPLVHLIRNSCDHGIESPEVRKAAGKPGRGTVRLSAYHTGPSVFIEIRDDGAGLDAEAIRSKAIERGLLTADATPSQQELFKLIFEAGFSTAKALSNVSGRGVGMDVVKRSIDALRGSVDVQSVQGQGTTIRLRLPLTLAIIEGLLVAVGETRYVLPMSLVEECVELTRQDVERSHGNSLATVRGELVPYLRLREWFSTAGGRPTIEQIVIVSAEGARFGFVVDAVVGQHQTVIKTLGHMYRNTEGLSGATILGDGTVALIVDVSALMRACHAGLQVAS
jgi:two-component system, chemotaxis family, sensor kinase CheA